MTAPKIRTQHSSSLRGLGISLYKPLWHTPGIHELVRPAARAVRRRWFIRDLRTIHDLLEETALAGRYWVWGGLLLGWAREGRPLRHDRDADFAILSEDLPQLEEAVLSLERAGFKLAERYENNAGVLTEITFVRAQISYDFFLMQRAGDKLRYYVYGGPQGQQLQCEALLAAQPLVPFEFLGRTWLKVADHEGQLEAIYGDWKTPDKNWSYLDDDRCIVARERWQPQACSTGVARTSDPPKEAPIVFQPRPSGDEP